MRPHSFFENVVADVPAPGSCTHLTGADHVASLTAAGLVTLCVSAFVMWRRRAPEGVLGAPPPIPDARVGIGLAAIILVAAILLPVLGASLIVLALVEHGVLSRWPSARRWLGIAPA